MHLSASHSVFATVCDFAIYLVQFATAVYSRRLTMPDLQHSRARFALRSGASFMLMPLCPWTHLVCVSVLASRRVLALLFIHLGRACTGAGSRCSDRRMAACETLKMNIFVTLCICSESLFLRDCWSASPITHDSGSLNSISPVRRWLRKALPWSQCLHTVQAPTLPSSDQGPVQPPHPGP